MQCTTDSVQCLKCFRNKTVCIDSILHSDYIYFLFACFHFFRILSWVLTFCKFLDYFQLYWPWINSSGDILDGKCFRHVCCVDLHHLQGAWHLHGFSLQLILWVHTTFFFMLYPSLAQLNLLFFHRCTVHHRQLHTATCCLSQAVNLETSRVLHHQSLHQWPWDDTHFTSTGHTIGVFTQVS